MNRSTWYAAQAIAASGFAVMSPMIAYQLRPDLWANGRNCQFDFERDLKLEGTLKLVATFPTHGDVVVLTRSRRDLAQRLEWIVGEAPTSIADWHPEVPAVSPQQALKRAANKKEVERLEALRKVAIGNLPSHDCQERREVLAARRELGVPA